MRHALLLGARPCRQSAGTAHIADTVHGHVGDGPRIHVLDVHVGDVVHLTVVPEVAIAPVTAFITVAEIAEAVHHASIEADLRRPVARIPDVEAVYEAPISRRPQQAHRGRLDPRPRNPVVAVWTVVPVARYEDVAGRRDRRLLVHRDRRGTEGDGKADLGGCRCGEREGTECQAHRHQHRGRSCLQHRASPRGE